ncbi:carboxypeptidase-like regulatory domain-containing protein [Luteolibacter luteus]|uniref:Carboxypeptidase regulatory-like domain-containing protein n=1 Tax=Luteolibacter luteus TaxID=2728835 RepID=A0A858RMT0_9BACT|nr:carboxypeptidase-like regulatory domain-containing protein [Luteolibacter luteus]QJE97480.1 carboxypeptidase regulatory-like domain-containing protein [Luteolibacter luteus]
MLRDHLQQPQGTKGRFYGRVIDPLGGPIAGASVPWKLEKYLWFDISGVAHTDSEGYFSINGRRLSGDILTIRPIGASDYQDTTPSDRRIFRYGWWRGKDEHEPFGSEPVFFELRRNDSPTSP